MHRIVRKESEGAMRQRRRENRALDRPSLPAAVSPLARSLATIGILLIGMTPAGVMAQAAIPNSPLSGSAAAPPAISTGPQWDQAFSARPDAAPGPAPSQPVASSAAPASAGPRLLPPAHKSDGSTPGASMATRADQSLRTSGLPSLVTVGASLAVVLGLFLLSTWLMRRTGAGAATVLSKDVFQVLGRAPLAGRQHVHLLRCGNKLLLVCASPAGVETLTEIVDPVEVDRLAGLCQQTRADSTTAVFRQVFQQFTSERVRRTQRAAVASDPMELANHGIADLSDGALEKRHA